MDILAFRACPDLLDLLETLDLLDPLDPLDPEAPLDPMDPPVKTAELARLELLVPLVLADLPDMSDLLAPLDLLACPDPQVLPVVDTMSLDTMSTELTSPLLEPRTTRLMRPSSP